MKNLPFPLNSLKKIDRPTDASVRKISNHWIPIWLATESCEKAFKKLTALCRQLSSSSSHLPLEVKRLSNWLDKVFNRPSNPKVNPIILKFLNLSIWAQLSGSCFQKLLLHFASLIILLNVPINPNARQPNPAAPLTDDIIKFYLCLMRKFRWET